MSRKRSVMPKDAAFTPCGEIACPECGHEATSAYTAAKGPHTAAWCLNCERFIKFLPKAVAHSEELSVESTKPAATTFYIVTASKREGLGIITCPIGTVDSLEDRRHQEWQVAKAPGVTLRYEKQEVRS